MVAGAGEQRRGASRKAGAGRAAGISAALIVGLTALVGGLAAPGGAAGASTTGSAASLPIVRMAEPRSTLPPSPGTWSEIGSATSLPAFNATACWSSSGCLAVGTRSDMAGAADVTNDGGLTWSEVTLPSKIVDLTGVACPAVSTCAAVGVIELGTAPSAGDGVFISTTNGGVTWSEAVIGSTDEPSAVACSSATTCFVTGTLASSSPSSPVPDAVQVTDMVSVGINESMPAGYYTSIACPQAGVCIASGIVNGGAGAVAYTTNGGATWSAGQPSSTFTSINAVACTNAYECVAVGDQGPDQSAWMTSTTEGRTWTCTSCAVGTSKLTGVSCTTSGHCVAVGPSYFQQGEVSAPGVAMVSSNGGTSFQEYVQQQIPPDPASVACPTATFCVKADGTVLYTSTDGGVSWVTPAVPAGLSLTAVSCPTTTDCTAIGVGSTGAAVVATDDGWQTVHAETLPASVGYTELAGISCPTVAFCMTVGGNQIFTTTDGGSTWTEHAVPIGTFTATAVTCPQADWCTISGVGSIYGLVVTATGASLSYPPIVNSGIVGSGSLADMTAISCANPPGTTISCVATGAVYAGGPWASPSGVVINTVSGFGRVNYLSDVDNVASHIWQLSCSSVSYCMGVGPDEITTTSDGGATWTSALTAARFSGFPVSVSCPRDGTCAVVGVTFTPGVAPAATEIDGTWMPTQAPASALIMNSVSCPDVTACFATGVDANGATAIYAMRLPLPGPVTAIGAAGAGPTGYWLADAQGCVSAHGAVTTLGSMCGKPLNAPISHLVPTPDGKGYWLVAADGGVFCFGDASFYGSMGGRKLNAPVVALAATPDGKGYWLVGSDGGVFAFGDAAYKGSMGGKPLNKPVVGIAGDPATGGYWLVASDGGIFAFGAPFRGSAGALHLNQPVVGMAVDPVTDGYWLVASDGGIFAFGAPYRGSTGGLRLNKPVVGMAADPATGGYWLVAADGGVFAFGAPFEGAD